MALGPLPADPDLARAVLSMTLAKETDAAMVLMRAMIRRSLANDKTRREMADVLISALQELCLMFDGDLDSITERDEFIIELEASFDR